MRIHTPSRPRQHARATVTRRRDADDDATRRGDESSVNLAMGINDHDTFTGLAPLHKAAADGDLEKVIALLDDGADGNIRACGEVRPKRGARDAMVDEFFDRTRASGRGGTRRGGGRRGNSMRWWTVGDWRSRRAARTRARRRRAMTDGPRCGGLTRAE
jgi:hypothetical protein